MYLLLKSLRKAYKLIISEITPISIAGGFTLGMVLGLTPLLAVHNLLIAVVVLMVRFNLSAVLFGMAIFKLLGVPCWGAFHQLGVRLLSDPGLTGFWTTVTNAPGLSLLGLNNSQILGSLVVSAALFPIVLVISLLVVRWGRRVFTEERQKHWLAKAVTRSKAFAYLVRWAD